MKILKTILLATVVIMFSCTDRDDSSTSDTRNSELSESPIIDSSHNRIMDSTPVATTPDYSTPEGPATFANEAATGGLMEVNLATYAQANALSKEVKDYAKMLGEDHGKVNAELKNIAAAKNITIPSSMGTEKEAMVNQLKALKGAEFDKAYINMMVDDHNNDIQKFHDAATKLPDAELKAFAEKTIPALQKHLDKAKALQAKL